MKVNSLSHAKELLMGTYFGYNLDINSKELLYLATKLLYAYNHPKVQFEVSFTREADGGWYIDFPDWPGSHGALAMVCGSDKMLDAIGHGNPTVRVEGIVSETPISKDKLEEGWIELSLQRSTFEGGGTYLTRGIPDFVVKFPWSEEYVPRTVWLCPVALFVFGQYPKYLHAKVVE